MVGRCWVLADVIRTLRIKKKYDAVITEEAKKSGASVNSFFNQLLDRYVMTFRFIDVFPCLIIPSEMVRGLLENVTEEKIIKEGKAAGSYIPKHSLFLEEKEQTIDNILLIMEKVMIQHSNWYQFNSQTTNGKTKLLLRHKLGKNWSIYLNAYYQTLFKQLFNITIKSEIGKDSLAITFTKNTKTNNQ